MLRVLFDTNIILDIALKREPFFETASKLFKLIDQQKIVVFITATTITDIYYISKRQSDHRQSVEFILSLVQVVSILGIDSYKITEALKSNFSDFEDAIQNSAAEFNEIDSLVTRNQKDYTGSNLDIFEPNELLEIMKQQN